MIAASPDAAREAIVAWLGGAPVEHPETAER
jgi:hypothetical protein